MPSVRQVFVFDVKFFELLAAFAMVEITLPMTALRHAGSDPTEGQDLSFVALMFVNYGSKPPDLGRTRRPPRSLQGYRQGCMDPAEPADHLHSPVAG